jgi:hypothetical protein
MARLSPIIIICLVSLTTAPSQSCSVINASGRVSVPTMSVEMEQVLNLWKIEESDSEFSLYEFDQIADATNNFSDESKLGQGGFGPVYKVLI